MKKIVALTAALSFLTATAAFAEAPATTTEKAPVKTMEHKAPEHKTVEKKKVEHKAPEHKAVEKKAEPKAATPAQ